MFPYDSVETLALVTGDFCLYVNQQKILLKIAEAFFWKACLGYTDTVMVHIYSSRHFSTFMIPYCMIVMVV